MKFIIFLKFIVQVTDINDDHELLQYLQKFFEIQREPKQS